MIKKDNSTSDRQTKTLVKQIAIAKNADQKGGKVVETEKMENANKYQKYIDAVDSGKRSGMNVLVLMDFKHALLIGSTKKEAYNYAGIYRQNYHAWLKELKLANPELYSQYKMEVQKWKNDTILKARLTVSNLIGVDGNTARWFLERKKKKEFATLQKTENNTVHTIESVDEETLKKMAQAVLS